MIDPPETMEIEVKPVTHVIWNSLSRLDKINRTNKILEKLFGNVKK